MAESVFDMVSSGERRCWGVPGQLEGARAGTRNGNTDEEERYQRFKTEAAQQDYCDAANERQDWYFDEDNKHGHFGAGGWLNDMRTPISDDRLRRSQGHIRSGDAAFLAGNFERAYDQYAKVDDTFDSHWGSLDQKAILADACSKCGRCRVSSTHFQAAVNVLNKVLESQQTTFEKADGTTEALALPAMDAQHVASRYWRARARWDFSEMCSVQRRGTQLSKCSLADGKLSAP
jgi:hypothetical protein